MPRKRRQTSRPVSPEPQPTLQPNNVIDPSVFLGSMTRYRQPHIPDALRTELSIPRDSHLITTTLRAPLGYDGYTWEMVGAFPRPDTAIEAFVFRREVWMERYGLPELYIYRRRVYHPDTLVFLYLRF